MDVSHVMMILVKCSLRFCFVPIILRGVNPGGVWGSQPPDFGLRGRGGVAGGSLGGRGRVVKYYYILSCTKTLFESGDFWREIVYFAKK